MSEFTSKLIVRPLEKDELAARHWGLGWQLQKSFVYDLGRKGGGDKITLPAGYESNGASVPRWLWWLVHPCDPDVGKAAWVHDYCYQRQEYSKPYCDAVFLDGLITLGCPSWKAIGCYEAVHLFGWSAWRQSQVESRRINPDCQLPYPALV